LGSSLVGSMYILDEPSIGLHPRDTQRLIHVLKQLRDLGNSVIVVEHDEEVMRAADHIIDMGPEAGTPRRPGGLQRERTPNCCAATDSRPATSAAASSMQTARTPPCREGQASPCSGAAENNLKGIDVHFPLNMLTVVTGVSGSGKTTLVKRILLPCPAPRAGGRRRRTTRRIQGTQRRSAPHRRRGNGGPASHRPFFAQQSCYLREGLGRHPPILQRAREPPKCAATGPLFSASTWTAGAARVCQGEGVVHIEMQFMADINFTCEVCHGKRFKEEILDVKFQGGTLAQVLDITVDDALALLQQRMPKSTTP
jgi:excinuclease ABC subunit A